MKGFWTVQCVNNKEATSRSIVGAEKHFDEVHNSCPVALSRKIFTCAETAYEYSGETFERFVAQICVIEKLFFVFIRNTIGQANTVIGKRKSSNYGVRLALQTKEVGFAKQLMLIDKTIVGEEFINIPLATTKCLAFCGSPVNFCVEI